MKQFINIPEELMQLPQWVCRKDKIPFNPVIGEPAKAGQQATWASFEDAVNAFNIGGYDGIGFEFNDNGIVGIDLDLEGVNAIIERSLELYFTSIQSEVWEKSLSSGWIKKLVIAGDSILYENIKCRKTLENYRPEEYTQQVEELRKLIPITGYKLQTMPGIDLITEAQIISEIGDINRFPDSDKLARYGFGSSTV